MDLIALIVYVSALAFQIAGAVLLIIKYWGNTEQRVINVYYPGTGIASNDGDDNAILEVNRVRECVAEIYGNRMAFIYIAVGYALSIFGNKGTFDNVVVLAMVTVLAVIFIVLEILLAKALAKKLYKEDIIISYNDLPDYIDRTLSEKAIDRMFSDTFDE